MSVTDPKHDDLTPDEDDTDLDFGPMEDDTFGLDDVERDLYASSR